MPRRMRQRLALNSRLQGKCWPHGEPRSNWIVHKVRIWPIHQSSRETLAESNGSRYRLSGAEFRRSGRCSGIAPEQLAALAASLLNADVDKATASASVKSISAVLAKGAKGSAEERAAWATLGLQPDKLTDDVPQTLFRTLEALKKQPASQQAALLKTLFNGDEGVSKLLERPQDVGQTFALLTAKKPLDPQTELLKKLSGGSEGLHQLMAQPSADGKAFSPLPLQGPTQSLEPQYKGAVQRSADAAGGSVQQSPDAYEASKIRLTKAVAPNVQCRLAHRQHELDGGQSQANPK